MRAPTVATLIAIIVVATAVAVGGCSGRGISPLAPEYEYEEDLTLSLDGSATMTVNASVPALIALRGLPLSADPRMRADQLKAQVRDVYTSPYTDVRRVSTWTRHGRRFVGVYLRVPDIRTLPKAAPFSWATYELRQDGEEMLLSTRSAGRPPRRTTSRGRAGTATS